MKLVELANRLNNCLFWALYKWITCGGRIRFKKSKLWWGPHVTWTDKEGIEWEYTLAVPQKLPWYWLPFYLGAAKRVDEAGTVEGDKGSL